MYLLECEASLKGRVYVGENSVVKRGAIIRGPATIGEKTVVEDHVYIGPYTGIGNT